VLGQPSLRKRNLGFPENDNLNLVCRSHCFGEFIELQHEPIKLAQSGDLPIGRFIT
jgi:hypothetical protein